MSETSAPSGSTDPPALVLAINLLIARLAAGLTQQQLSDTAHVARGTIAQLEAGAGDPRLSTVAALAGALNISPTVLLMSPSQVRSLGRLGSTALTEGPSVPEVERQRIRSLLSSGLLKDRIRAGKVGVTAARRAGLDAAGVVHAAIFTASDPDHGVILGAALVDSLPPGHTRETNDGASAAPRGPSPGQSHSVPTSPRPTRTSQITGA